MNRKIAIFCLVFAHIQCRSVSLGGWWSKIEKENISQTYDVTDKCCINVKNLEGSITVKPWAENKIQIDAVKSGSAEDQKNTTISAKINGSEASITTRTKPDQSASRVDYTLLIPENASLTISQNNGPVTIRGIHGSLKVSCESGAIDIVDSTKAVSANTGQGTISVQHTKLDNGDSIFLESAQGNISLSLPPATCASLHAKTAQGAITSDHPVTLAPVTFKLNKENWQRIQKEVDGSLGSKEGAPITIEAHKGNVALKEY